MAKANGGTRSVMPRRAVRDADYYYEATRRLKEDALAHADSQIGQHHFDNVISGTMEISKSDIRTIVSKRTQDNKFNAIKNALARDLTGFVEKAKYEGWAETKEGKHPEAAFFAYYSRELGAKAYLCMRYMATEKVYKPYAIISQKEFNEDIGILKKGAPPM